MKYNIYREKWIKRLFKNTLSLTLGIAVSIMINGGVAYASQTNEELLNEIRALRQEVQTLRAELEEAAPQEMAVTRAAAATGGTEDYININSEGDSSSATGTDSIAIGPEAKATEENTIAIGNKAEANNKRTVSIGYNTKAQGEDSVGIGSENIAGKKTVLVGNNLKFPGASNITVGNNVKTGKDDSARNIVIGNNIVLKNSDNEAVNNAIVIGNKKADESGDPVGDEFHVESDAIVIGRVSSSFSKGSIGIGNDTQSNKGVALGNRAHALKENAMALGEESVADYKNSVALGYKSKVEAYTPGSVEKSYLTGEEFDYEAGVVSVGNETIKRRVINVAGGVDDTDAVNVAQLKALNDKIEAAGTGGTGGTRPTTTAAATPTKLNYAGNDPAGTNYSMTLDKTFTVKGKDNGKNIVTTANSDGLIEVDLNKKIEVGSVTIDGTDGSNGIISNGVVIINNNGIDAGNKQITNVAEGLNDTDAVTLSQLEDKINNITITGGTPVDVKGSGAAVVTEKTNSAGHKEYNVHVDKMVQYVDKSGRELVKDGENFYVIKNGTIDRSTVIAKSDVQVNMVGADDGKPTKLGNVADGEIAPGSKDAINGGQLYEITRGYNEFDSRIADNSRQLRELRKDHNNGIAQMAAMSAVDFAHVTPNKLKVGAGVGGYKGARAVAVGVAYAPTYHLLMNAKCALPTNTHHGGAAGFGATYEFNCD